jgi:hypothetical protein
MDRALLNDEDELCVLLYEAARSPFGAIVRTNAPERLRQKLYPLLARTGTSFTFAIPAKAGELWLVKND